MTNWISPTPVILKEIRNTLESDRKTIGEVYRQLQIYPDDVPKIANEMGWKRNSPVYSYKYYILALEGEFVTSGSTLAKQIAQQTNSFLERHKTILSTSAIGYLQQLSKQFMSLSLDHYAITSDLERNKSNTRELLSSSGIYALTSRDKMNNPEAPNEIDPEHNRYLVKVGRANNVDRRVKGLVAGMTEDPLILLIIATHDNQDYKGLERKFHDHLTAIGHGRSEGAGGGTEWYVSNTVTLRSIADLLQLEIKYDFEADALGGV